MSRELRRVAVKDLRANPRNVRERLDGIDELAASIRAVGVLQPLVVNDRAGTLELIDGHRRLEAARRANIERLVCIVETDAGDQHVLSQMLAAAMHQQLKPIEQAKAFQRLRAGGMTTVEISRATGYRPELIRLRLTLLELPVEAQAMVEDKTLSVGQATTLAQQVRSTRRGAVTQRVKRRAWFTTSHPCAPKFCPHTLDRVLIAGRCGQCWEDEIRSDERDRITREAETA